MKFLMGKFRQIFTELSARDTPIFSFPEIWFGIANGQISSNFYGVICPRHAHIFVFG